MRCREEAKSGVRSESTATSTNQPLSGGSTDLLAFSNRLGRCSRLAGATGGPPPRRGRADPLRGRNFGPFAPQRNERRHHRRAEKQSEKAERLQPAEDSEQHPQKRQSRGAADQYRADKMIGDEHDDAAADDDDDAAGRVPRREQVQPGER